MVILSTLPIVQEAPQRIPLGILPLCFFCCSSLWICLWGTLPPSQLQSCKIATLINTSLNKTSTFDQQPPNTGFWTWVNFAYFASYVTSLHSDPSSKERSKLTPWSSSSSSTPWSSVPADAVFLVVKNKPTFWFSTSVKSRRLVIEWAAFPLDS